MGDYASSLGSDEVVGRAALTRPPCSWQVASLLGSVMEWLYKINELPGQKKKKEEEVPNESILSSFVFARTCVPTCLPSRYTFLYIHSHTILQ